MTRTKLTVGLDGVEVVESMTAGENAAVDAEVASWEAGASARDLVTLRTERNTLLTETDWTQYTDSPLTDEVKAEWAVYRQELRDLPAATDDPDDPTWPEEPE